MSGASSNTADWFTLLEPANVEPPTVRRADDPRLGEIVERWDGNLGAFQAGRAVIVGFPQDEGVKRNGGRVGAAKAPEEIRRWLFRLTTCHVQRKTDLAALPPLDLGNLRSMGRLDEAQESLGFVVGNILCTGAVPIILGGGHETAYGHYLGYVQARMPVGIVNIDAHLDVRPNIDGLGHSGSPFRQAMEHPTRSLPGPRYCCIGAEPFAVSMEHFRYLKRQGGRVWWGAVADLAAVLKEEWGQFEADGCRTMLTIDADAFDSADVPGVSAPNPLGFRGRDMTYPALAAGESAAVASMDLVEINPLLDVDGRSARWGALVVWHFLVGLCQRGRAGMK